MKRNHSPGDVHLNKAAQSCNPIKQYIVARLEDLYEKAEKRSQQLQLTYELHDEWKQRGDKLLYSMIPQSVADALRHGADTLQTCQVPLHLLFLGRDFTTFIQISTQILFQSPVVISHPVAIRF